MCRLLIFIAFILLINKPVFSQQPSQEWVSRIGGPFNDLYGPFLSVDNQGNCYVAGTHVVNDSINILCVKYNYAGIQQWYSLYKYPGFGYFVPTGMATDSSGNAYVISGIAPTYLAPRNMMIVKFNTVNGNTEWAKTYFGQYSQSSFFDIKIDSQNNIYVAGSSDSSHLVIRYNTNGDSVWVKKYHPPWLTSEYLRSCIIDDSLNVIITGQRRFYYPPFGWYDSLLVAKYSPGGVLRWNNVYAYNLLGSDIGNKITSDQNGNSYIAGVSTVSGNSVYLTLKYDRNGNRLWSKIYYPSGSTQNDIYGIAVSKISNDLFVTGYSVVNFTGSAATIKYNSLTGDSVWVYRSFGVPGSSSSRDLKIDSTGNALITGSSAGTSSSDLSTLKFNQQGSPDWLMRYNGPFNGIDGGRALAIFHNDIYVLGISQFNSQVSDYAIIKYNQAVGINNPGSEIPAVYKLEQNYPNPFNPVSKFKILVPKSSTIKITIYDILGRVVDIPVNDFLNPGVFDININGSGFASGSYFYQMNADGCVIDTKKFIIIK